MYATKRCLMIVLSVATVAAMGTGAYAEDVGTVKGKVIFKGDASKKAYKRKRLDTSKDPNCAKSKAKIGSERVIINKKTDPMTLRNVIVSIKSGLGDRTFTTSSEPVVLTQLGCQYKPHIIGIMAGQPLKVVNGDETNHNIHFLPKKNVAFNKTQPKKGMTDTLTLEKEAPFKVKCDVHPWMGCHIAVFDHPFFVVTGKKGTFELKNVPAGKYTIEAWHEKFGSVTLEVEVAAGATVETDFTFEPDK